MGYWKISTDSFFTVYFEKVCNLQCINFKYKSSISLVLRIAKTAFSGLWLSWLLCAPLPSSDTLPLWPWTSNVQIFNFQMLAGMHLVAYSRVGRTRGQKNFRYMGRGFGPRPHTPSNRVPHMSTTLLLSKAHCFYNASFLTRQPDAESLLESTLLEKCDTITTKYTEACQYHTPFRCLRWTVRQGKTTWHFLYHL